MWDKLGACTKKQTSLACPNMDKYNLYYYGQEVFVLKQTSLTCPKYRQPQLVLIVGQVGQATDKQDKLIFPWKQSENFGKWDKLCPACPIMDKYPN